MTPLDELCQIPFHRADAAARARILSQLADTELFAALSGDPAGDRAELQTYALPDGIFALACDREDRLAEFVGGPVSHLALPGRVLAEALAQEGQGLLVNPGHASELMLDSAMLGWLAGALAIRPSLGTAETARHLSAPDANAVSVLAGPLAQRLGDMVGLVGQLGLVAAEWADGRRGHMLILRDVDPAHEGAVAKALAEFIAFLPELPGGVDIAFSGRALPAQALIVEPPPPDPAPPVARRDPKAPPRLR